MPQKNPEVQLSQDLLYEYSSNRTDWAKQAVEDNEFRNGNQWTKKQVDILRSRAQEPVVVNVIHAAVEQAKAMLTTNLPRFQSTAREISDTNIGKNMSDIMSFIWSESDGNTMLKQAIDDYYVKGMGILNVYFDPHKDFGKGEICIKSVDPLDVYFDPNSQDKYCRDSGHVLIAKKIMKAELAKNYPEYLEIIMQAQPTSYIKDKTTSRYALQNQQILPTNSNNTRSPDDDEEVELIERYTKVKNTYVRVYDKYDVLNKEKVFNEQNFLEYRKKPAWIKISEQEKDPVYITADSDVIATKQLYEEIGPVYHITQDPLTGQNGPTAGVSSDNMVPDSVVEIKPTTIGHLVDSGIIEVLEVLTDNIQCVVSVGDEHLYTYIKPIDSFPIIPIMNGFNRNPYPVSDVRLVKGLQEYVNKIRSLIIAHASSSTNVKLLIPRGSMNKAQLEEEWAKAGTAVIEFDPELGQPIVAGPVPLPNELYNNEKQARQDIEQILGIYALMQGDQSAAPQTYKGTLALDEFGQRRIRSKKDDIESGLNMLARLCIQFIQQLYTQEKVIRLLQPNNTVSELVINQNQYNKFDEFVGKLNDVTVGSYDIQVISGSTLPNNRWARYEYYKELFQLGVIDQTELLKQTDVADMEGVLQRASKEQQLTSQLQSLNEEHKDLQGDMQTLERELMHAKRQVELSHFQVKLAKAEAKAEMAGTLYKSRSEDELKKLKDSVRTFEKEAEKESSNDRLIGLED